MHNEYKNPLCAIFETEDPTNVSPVSSLNKPEIQKLSDLLGSIRRGKITTQTSFLIALLHDDSARSIESNRWRGKTLHDEIYYTALAVDCIISGIIRIPTQT